MPAPSKVERELQNFVKSVRSVARRNTKFQHGPSTLEFSHTSACNLRCVMCSQSDNLPVVKADPEKAAKFLDKAFESVVIWNPSATSEPLLNDIDDMVRTCVEKGAWLELYTNATRLTPAVYEKLAPHIHRLTMSIDSHVPEVLETVRWPVKASKLFPNVEYALRRGAELSIPTIINAVLMKETVPHFADLVDWVADRGGKEITVLDLLDSSSQARGHDAIEDLGIERVQELLEDMRERAAERGLNLTFLLPPPLAGRYTNVENPTRIHEANVVEAVQEAHASEMPGFCPMVASYLKVMPNGDAYPCCRAPHELKLGNVYEQPFEEVWNGAKAQSLRSAMFQNKPPEPCKNCLVRAKNLADVEQKIVESGDWVPL
ncbi:MAG: radical SAM protein [Planctomycetes bacterium]|nr:radical SAM protein [Planctomycetota bacterium]